MGDGNEGLLSRIDKSLGEGLESMVERHHRRRLGKVGWDFVFDPPDDEWAEGSYPPRDGNSVEVLVDGADYFPRLLEAISSAKRHIFMAGWYFNPDFEVRRGDEPLTITDVLAETARTLDVRVLAWAGAPAPPNMRTSRSRIKRIGAEFARRAPIHFARDTKEHILHCHHEKVVVVDDEVAFVGGLDLTHLSGDRFDSNEHPRRDSQGWHDVSTHLSGPVVADASNHFRMRWREVTGEDLGAAQIPDSAGDSTVQLVRTIPEGIYDAVPKGDFSIMDSYMRAFRRAERFIYLENQFLWSQPVVDLLSEKLKDPPREGFRLIMVLPSKPNTGYDDTMGQLAQLAECDDGAGRFLAATIYSRGTGNDYKRVYIHAKVAIVDDEWLTIGSANLNHHSLFNDTEVNVAVRDPELAIATRRHLWSEHLECGLEEAGDDPTDLFERLWRPIATDQGERRKAGEPLTHRLVGLPHVSKRSKRLIGPIQSLLVDG